jgi:hypothetical protein
MLNSLCSVYIFVGECNIGGQNILHKPANRGSINVVKFLLASSHATSLVLCEDDCVNTPVRFGYRRSI